MTYWHFLLIQLNIILFYLVYIWLSNRTNHFKFNRLFLLIAPLISIALPMVGNKVVTIMTLRFSLETISAIAQPLNEVSTVSFSYSNLLLFTGILISILLFIVSLMRILRSSKGELLMQMGKIKIYRTSSTHSYSFYRSIYINDRQTENLELVIQHELAHCNQLHSFDLIFFALIKSIFWYNPIIYLWNKKIQENHEYLADESVLKSNIEFEVYAKTILSAHFNSTYPHLVNGFNEPSLLQKRIKKMKHKNKTYMKHLIFIPALAVGLIATTSLSKQPEKISSTAMMRLADELTQPEFPGGQSALATYIGNNVRYPESSVKAKEAGTAFIQFIVKKSGEIASVKILRGTGFESLDNEAIRLVSSMPKWKPGTKNGENIESEMQLPINFALD